MSSKSRSPYWFIFIVGILIILVSCQESGAGTTVSSTANSNNQPVTTALTQVTSAPPTTAAESAALEEETATAVSPITPPDTPANTPTPADTPPPLPTPFVTPSQVSSPTGEVGALIGLTLNSTVGVLLDELPAGERDRIAAEILQRPSTYWDNLAREQVRLTYNRLHFRPFFYDHQKWQLPLPPKALWQIELSPDGPYRATVNGHDLVLFDYTYSSTLLTDIASTKEAEPALGKVGGTWDEPFILPLDPTQLRQRTGNACVNESGFPPNSFDAKNYFIYYDYTCEPDSVGPAGCHRSQYATLSCQDALNGRIGTIETAMRFERQPWIRADADAVRVGEVVAEGAPDVMVVADDLSNNHIVYRYFSPNSCAAQEQCISGAGWRRLLMFNATAHNLGTEALAIGKVNRENPLNNMFVYNSCHDHYHFANYGEFQFGFFDQPAKQAFCVESTSRFSNNEASPLTHNFTCSNQGIQAGWVDEYVAGLDCQWIDITDTVTGDETVTLPLTFRFNQDGFLCEGQPVLDENGQPAWEPTGLRNQQGLPLSRPQCDFVDDWYATNEGTREVTVPPVGSYVTEPCANGEIGPRRNCGFTEQPLPPLPTPAPTATPDKDSEIADSEPEPVYRCQPGEKVELTCSLADEQAPPQVLRICETSAVLGVGTACTYTAAIANVTISDPNTAVAFTCPAPRDENEPGGDYAFYTAPAFPEDKSSAVVCTAVDQ